MNYRGASVFENCEKARVANEKEREIIKLIVFRNDIY
jgi:hypothetical protein